MSDKPEGKIESGESLGTKAGNFQGILEETWGRPSRDSDRTQPNKAARDDNSNDGKWGMRRADDELPPMEIEIEPQTDTQGRSSESGENVYRQGR